MIQISVQHNIDDVTRWLTDVQRKQVPFATALALTRTAKDVEAAVYDEFRSKFDRPTPMTMKSLRTKPAKPKDLTAMVYMKDRALGGKNPNSMAEILAHQFTGGSRIRKQLEYALQRFNFISQSEYVVPGAAARLDKYGNMSKGQITQILSQLGVKQMGYDSTPTGSKRSKRNVAKAGTIFWSHGPEGRRIPLVDKATGIAYGYSGGNASRLPKGAWIRDGRTVKPILIVVKGTNYRKRIDLNKIGQATVDKNLRRHFDEALAHALATAR